MTTRVGLSHISSSARNSPFNEKIVVVDKNAGLEPLKIAAFKKYKPITPSPLATTPTNKITFEITKSTSCQTVVSVSQKVPEIREEDLTSEKPTINYLQNMALRLSQDLEKEFEKNLKLTNTLFHINEEIKQLDHDLEILQEVIEEIEQEKQETGTSDV